MHRRTIPVLSVFAASFLVLACSDTGMGPEPSEDELAGESDLDGEIGKADGVDSFTFFRLEQDARRCVSPLCGGFWASRVNRSVTRCADGTWADRCYVADADLSGTGLSPAQIDDVHANLHGGMLVRGDIVAADFGTFGTLGRMQVSEAWRAGTESEPEGLFTRVTDSGLVCITTPCYGTLHEGKLNSVLHTNMSELDLSWSDAEDDVAARAYDEVFGEGLIVAGYRYWFYDGGWQAGRVATQFYVRVQPEEATTTCVRAGCSGQLCVGPEDAGIITTCEFRPEYACLQQATCEAQDSGECGFTPTAELQECLANAGG